MKRRKFEVSEKWNNPFHISDSKTVGNMKHRKFDIPPLMDLYESWLIKEKSWDFFNKRKKLMQILMHVIFYLHELR